MTCKTFNFLALTCLVAVAVVTDQIWAKPSQPKQADSQEIKALTAEGDAQKAKNRDKEALAAYQKALARSDKTANPKQWARLALDVAQSLIRTDSWKEAETLCVEILSVR